MRVLSRVCVTMMLDVLSKSRSYVSCTIGPQRLPFVTNVILSKWDVAVMGKNRSRRNGRGMGGGM